MSDLKIAFRQIARNPGFSAIVIVTLALGIGANSAIFSVLDQLLLRPLPVSKPERLALVGQPARNGNVYFEFNYPLFLDYQRQNSVFEQLSATGEMDVGLGTGGATDRQRALVVSGNYFSTLGVNAAVGRTFAKNEGAEIDDAAVVVLSHGLWQRRFGADPQVIGKTVTVNARPFTIIGVAPREFSGTSRATAPDLYLPITVYGQLTGPLQGGEHPLRTRFFTWLFMFGRLKPGITLEQAQVAMSQLASEVYAVEPANTSTNLVILSGAKGFTQDLREARLPLNLLLAVSGLVLLIACANLANLQLARATARFREFAIRLALGAGHARLIRALILESVLLALAGGGLGLVLAMWLVDLLSRFRPPNSDFLLNNNLNLRLLMFTFAASVFTGVLFGLAPAIRASRPRLIPELKGGAGATESHVGGWNLRSILAMFQVALSLLVLVGAGLCLRSLGKLQRVEPGADPSQVVLMSLDLGLNDYSEGRAKDFYLRLLERVRSLPGVEVASLGLVTPLSGRSPAMSVERLEGYQPPPNEHPFAEFNIVAPDYFRTLGLPFLQGRDFSASEPPQGNAVVVVNEAFVQRYWPGQDVVGKRIFQHGPNGGTATEVVGVVRSAPTRALTEAPRPAFYFPLGQKSDSALTLVVRTGLSTGATIPVLRELVRSLDPTLPVFNVRTLAQQKDGSLALQRMAATLLTGFGVLGLFLAALGIYGVIAYSVSRRTREIGVRLALGAQLADVLLLVFRQGLHLVFLGLLLGLAGAFAATRVLRGFLYQVEPTDPVTFALVIAVLVVAALAACWLPARRATKVDPMQALRYE
jgi:predicted permease